MENQKSALGLDGNVTALIGYIIGIVALILIFIEKDNKFVRFHAIQSVLYSVGFIVVYIVAMIFITIVTVVLGTMSETLGMLSSLLYLLLVVIWLAWFAGLIYAAVKAFGGNMFKLPIVGGMAEKWSS